VTGDSFAVKQKSTKMGSSEQTSRQRQYYIDWLRIGLILSVFFFHIGMIFNSWEWHIKNDMTYGYQSALWYIMTFLSGTYLKETRFNRVYNGYFL
jgi:peptidoglycan/LPS O-acetylase OafA/YrhL